MLLALLSLHGPFASAAEPPMTYDQLAQFLPLDREMSRKSVVSVLGGEAIWRAQGLFSGRGNLVYGDPTTARLTVEMVGGGKFANSATLSAVTRRDCEGVMAPLVHEAPVCSIFGRRLEDAVEQLGAATDVNATSAEWRYFGSKSNIFCLDVISRFGFVDQVHVKYR